MPITLLELPLDAVAVDEDRAPDRDDSLIVEHLLRCCATFDPLPAIGVTLDGTRALVVRGHKYLLVAHRLGRRLIRAVVMGESTNDQVDAFVRRAGGRLLDWEAIRAAEALDPTPKGWDVFFFERPLSPAEKVAFEAAMAPLFREALEVRHDDAGPVAEFEARMPVTDEAWVRRHLEAVVTFHEDHVPIVSFQGRRFEGPSR